MIFNVGATWYQRYLLHIINNHIQFFITFYIFTAAVIARVLIPQSHLLYGGRTAAVETKNQDISTAAAEFLRPPYGRHTAILESWMHFNYSP